MEYKVTLSIETFLAVAEMVAAQLRIKRDDRWSSVICELKFMSFCSEFPEVNDPQFLWSAEQWLQGTAEKEFLRYPTWKELMAPLYRCENGLARRDWGFKDDLPQMCLPTAAQQKLLPPPPGPPSVAPLPPRKTGPGLTAEVWEAHLRTINETKARRQADEEIAESDRAKESSGTGTVDRKVECA
jgi:hypothetical protein